MKWLHIAAGAFALAVLFFLLPEEKQAALREGWQRVSNRTAIDCLDYERTKLKDPDSARLVGTFPVPADDSTLTKIGITYKAKNGYGAYSQGEVKCVVSQGMFNPDLTDMERATEALTVENDCRRAVLIRAGREGASFDSKLEAMKCRRSEFGNLWQASNVTGCTRLFLQGAAWVTNHPSSAG